MKSRFLRSVARHTHWKSYALPRAIVGRLDLLRLWLGHAFDSDVRVSLCTTTKDRFEHLEQTFLRNVRDNDDYPNCELVLLNYNCPDPRTEAWVKSELTPLIEAGRVNYFFYPDATRFEMAHSRNLAFRLARGDVICNIDADNFTGAGFAAYVAAVLSRDHVFLRGIRDRRGLSGRICVRRRDWEAVSGYDERFRDWGAEDGDIARRLRATGLRRKSILLERFCGSILHSDELRSRHMRQDKDASYKEQRALLLENARLGITAPNSSGFGHGRVQKNFREWIDV